MANANDPAAAERRTQVAAILALLDAEDSYAACRAIEQGRTALEAAELYHAVAQPLYLQRKDVRGMIALSRAGIHLALTAADRVESSDAETARSLRGQAKTLAYDLGSNLWPGWQDEGIVLTPADLATGLEAARLNLRLAEELDRAALPRCNAHWLLGAHELARGEAATARVQFELAAAQAQSAEKPEYVAMCQGYAAVTDLQRDSMSAAAAAEFDRCVQALREMRTDDAGFFADQLVSVRKFTLAAQP